MRVKGGTVRHANRKRIMKRAEGYFGARHRLYKTAKESVMRADWYSFNGRKERKQDYRTSYSQFMFGLKLANVELNRKMLSEIAATNPDQFKNLVEVSSKAIVDSKNA